MSQQNDELAKAKEQCEKLGEDLKNVTEECSRLLHERSEPANADTIKGDRSELEQELSSVKDAYNVLLKVRLLAREKMGALCDARTGAS